MSSSNVAGLIVASIVLTICVLIGYVYTEGLKAEKERRAVCHKQLQELIDKGYEIKKFNCS